MINESINKKILAMWRKYFDFRTDVYAPSFYNDFKQGGILFVGMNPSLNFPVFRAGAEAAGHKMLNPEAFLRWSGNTFNPENVDINIKIDECIGKTYKRYFHKMDEIAEEADLPYQYLDLFVYRQTKQHMFLALIRDKKGNLNEFGRDQLDIFHEIVEDICPVIIIVSNAGASTILRKEWKDNISPLDQERGFNWLSLNGDRIPIFFSAMLSGGALDIGSYERLKWHIKHAVK